MIRSPITALLAVAAISNAAIVPAAQAAAPAQSPAMSDLLDYARDRNTTGLLVIRDGKILTEQNWPAPEGDAMFANFVYGRSADGALLEDVASQQKSFVAVLMAIAADKGLVDLEKPVSAYLGAGWSKAAPQQEAAIRVIDLLTMSSGLDEKFAFAAPANTLFFYNTPVYAVTKRILVAVAKQPLEALTGQWLTGPMGMKDTAWRRRPAALASIGNDTGLVTTPRDTALFGMMVLNKGVSKSGKRIVSEAGIEAMFAWSATNPAYGRLWWLNGSSYTMRVIVGRTEGPLVAAAPADMVAALGAFDRKLYIVPSLKLIVVRTGAATGARDFDEQLWARLMKVLE
jgi:CubicO group peptidase (beta-lactamase class C family)